MSTETPIPDDYELATWSHEDGTKARDALIARITDETRVTAIYGCETITGRTSTNFLGERRFHRSSMPLPSADSISAVVPVAEPAWASCRAVMDDTGGVWTGIDRIDARLTLQDLEANCGPIRPLVDADGRVILTNAEIGTLAVAIIDALADAGAIRAVSAAKGSKAILDTLHRLHGFGGAR